MERAISRGVVSRQVGASALALVMFAGPALAVAGEGQAGKAQASDAQVGDVQVRTAVIRGTVFGADGLETIGGAVVRVANIETRAVFSSVVTKADGAYRLTDLPAGSYDLAVDVPAGLFVSDGLVKAEAGKKTLVSMALREARQEEVPAEEGTEAGAEKGEETGDDAGSEPEPEPEKKKKKGGGFFRSATGAAILIVAGAVAVGVAASSATDGGTKLKVMTPGGGN